MDFNIIPGCDCIICDPEKARAPKALRAERVKLPEIEPIKLFLIQDLSKLIYRCAEITKRARGRGWFEREFKKLYKITELGNGINATAYDIEGSGYILKVAYRTDGSYYWLKNALLSAADNPLMPRVLSVQDLADGGYIAVMEKLDEARGIREMERQSDDLLDLVYERERYDDSDFKRNIAANPKWMASLKNIRNIAAKIDGSVDMHYGNFMRRGEQIVITDPIC